MNIGCLAGCVVVFGLLGAMGRGWRCRGLALMVYRGLYPSPVFIRGRALLSRHDVVSRDICLVKIVGCNNANCTQMGIGGCWLGDDF